MPLILCGLPASGKTTVGKHLATRLHLPFIDTDALIEFAYAAKTGQALSCRQIYELKGALFFRALEKAQILSLDPLTASLIAIGGGSLEDPDSLRHLQQLGPLVYLQAPLDVLWNRMQQVPPYLNTPDPQTSFYALAKKRIPLYENAATLIVDTTALTKTQIAEKISAHFSQEK